ncbi:MAG: hypothetical protein R3B90_09790 [Planctomycetaceae bacterium]
MKQAEQFAQRTHEKNQIAELRNKIELSRHDTSRENDRKVAEATSAATVELQAVDRALDRLDFQEATRLLASVRAALQDVSTLKRGVNEATLTRLESAQTQLKERQERLDTARAASLLESRIVSQVEDASQFASIEAIEELQSLLEEYVEKFSEGRRAQDFRQAARDLELVKGAVAWQDALRTWGDGGSLVKVEDTTAENRAAFCSALLKAHPGMPDSATASRYRDYLAAVGRQDDVLASLVTLFQSPLLKDVWVIRSGDDRWYSLDGKTADGKDTIKEKLDGGADSIQFRYLYSSDGLTKEIQVNTTRNVTSIQPAPQADLSRRVAEQLGKARVASDWEVDIAGVLRTIHQDKATDALLRLILMENVLKQASTGSTTFAEASSAIRQLIDSSGIDRFAAWMDPKNPRATEARSKAEKLLETIEPPLGQLEKRLQEARREVLRPLLTRYDLAGILLRGGGEGVVWECRMSPARRKAVEGGQLYVVATPTVPSQGSWRGVSGARRSELQIDDKSPLMMEGRLVFVQRKLELPAELADP